MIVSMLGAVKKVLFPFMLNKTVTFIVGIPVDFLRGGVFNGTGRRGGTKGGLTEPMDLLLAVVLTINMIMLMVFNIVPRLAQAVTDLVVDVTGFVPRVRS